MKKSKELGKKNEGKEYKKVITRDKAAKIITNEINSRAKLNQADSYLKKKKKKEDFIEKPFIPITSFSDFKNQLMGAVKKDKANINKIKREQNKN